MDCGESFLEVGFKVSGEEYKWNPVSNLVMPTRGNDMPLSSPLVLEERFNMATIAVLSRTVRHEAIPMRAFYCQSHPSVIFKELSRIQPRNL